ncbi:hypothetical protein [Clostridium sp. ZBS20]|uniref:hypothetical protein n=1 Tax=Clostridium sp. ZBS20 TaxID=2949966 RepID=UPI00207AEE31|nr:hypothetical protein [Clostridium sp. ZBS20]
MKKEDGFEKFVAIFIFVLIFIATCITLTFKFSQYGYLLEIKDYFNFAASFGGAILSAMMSLMILYITVKQTREIQEENRIVQKENEKRQRRVDSLICMPILDIDYNKEYFDIKNKTYETMKPYIEDYNGCVEFRCWIKFKNIGKGPCKINSYTISFNYINENGVNSDSEYKVICGSNYIIPQEKTINYQISFKDENIRVDYKIVPIYTLNIYFSDVLKSDYVQVYTIFIRDNKVNNIQVNLPQLIEYNF